MPGTSERVQLLRDQLSRAAELSTAELWRLMSLEERKQGLLQICAGSSGPVASRALRTFLKRNIDGFRPQTIDAWNIDTLATRTARISVATDEIAIYALVGLYVEGDRSIQRTFFDAVGVTHVDGHMDQSQADALRYPAADVAKGVHAVLAAFPDSPNVLLYLLALSVMKSDVWTGLTPLLAELFTRSACSEATITESAEPLHSGVSMTDAIADADQAEDPDAERLQPANARPHRRRRHTILDRVLIQQAVSAAANAADAFPLSVMASVADEFVKTQPLRHQSYFHLGFVDALMGEPVRKELPSENAERWRWYDAGWVSGRWRRKDWQGIVTHFDAEARVRSLGDGEEASEYVTGELLKALVELDRHAEAAQFVTPSAYLAGGAHLPRQVLQVATTLLRDDRAGEARPYLTGLELGIALRRDAGFTGEDDLEFDLQRRLAHCLRHEGLYQESKERLLELLASATDIEPRYDAMVSADIGLIEGGVPRLSEIRLGANKAEADELVRSLRQGQARFEHAAQLACPESAHGRYPLGVIALAERRFADALPHLESALALFAGNPERYSGGGLIVSSRFFAALAGMASDAAAPRAPQFLSWINEGLAQQRSIPSYLLEDVLLGALVKDPSVAAGLVHELVVEGRQHTLDQIAHLQVDGAERVVAEALLGRFDKRRPATESDALLLVRSLTLAGLVSGREIAERALTYLLTLAEQRVATSRITALLEDKAATGWFLEEDDRSAILLRLHEALGQYDKAAMIIDRIGHPLLSGESFSNSEQVADLLERSKGYPTESQTILDGLRARLQNMQIATPSEPSAPPEPRLHASICIVGGNEIQMQYHDKLRKWAQGENLTLHFISSKWTSNWGDFVREFERHVENGLNGVVILRFVRTELGRAVRKRCERIAQIGTWGHGEQSIRIAILQVAMMARRQMETRIK